MTQALVISPVPTLSKRIFAIDLRSLAFFRILLASCLAIDFLSALSAFGPLYSDAGVLPRSAVTEFWPPGVTSSLYLMADQPALVALLLIAHGLSILALLVGYRSRLAAALCFVFTASLQNRNFLVMQFSDDLMRLLTFWAMSAPIGGKWAIDAALNEARPPRRVLSVGALALQCQALFVYFFGALIKMQSAIWTSGAAVGLAVADSTYGSGFGRLFLGYPALLTGVTRAVLALELLAPFLIWFPLRNTAVRLTALVLLVAMHLGFVVFLHVGIFPLVSLTSLSLLLPGAVWDRIAAWPRFRRAAAIRIYYDGGCLFCFKTALLLREFCLPETVEIAKAEAHPEAKRLLETHKSWVVYDDAGVPRLKWDAVAYVLRQSPVLWPLGRFAGREAMKASGERLYNRIGDNRPILGRLTARLLAFHRDSGRARLSTELLCFVLLAVATLYNVATIPGYQDFVPPWLADFVVDSRLEQKWAMFAPVPQSQRSWMVARAVTQDGQVLDVFHGRRRPYEVEPRDFPPYQLQKWVKYYEIMAQKHFSPLRLYYGRWICRTVNEGVPPGQAVATFSLHLVIEPTDPANSAPHEDIDLWDHKCF